MKTITSWDALLATPAPRDHLVQLYTRDAALVSTVVRWIERGVAAGDGVIVIATAPHRARIVAALRERSIDVAALEARAHLGLLDASETLAALLRDGVPDRAAMHALIDPVIGRARAAGCAHVRAFGEMVDLLNRRGDLAAALRLEELWNELIEAAQISLLCAYAVDAFDRKEYPSTLPGIGHAHSHLMPVEDGDRLERAIEGAFTEVFGLYADTRTLRELFVRHIDHATAMPEAQRTLLALHAVDPQLAGLVLERAGSIYRAA
jgi:hypothetical protein